MKSRRHAVIRNLIAAGEIYSQHELSQLLASHPVDPRTRTA
jgi:arginine repressor